MTMYAALSNARKNAERWARHVGVPIIGDAQLARLVEEKDTRNLYMLDVRDPEEYALKHPAGFVSAPGGQLVQATDEWVSMLYYCKFSIIYCRDEHDTDQARGGCFRRNLFTDGTFSILGSRTRRSNRALRYRWRKSKNDCFLAASDGMGSLCIGRECQSSPS